MTARSQFVALGSEGHAAPPINPLAQRQPVRLQRTRRKAAATPAGAVYVGRPTMWGNPFSERSKIGHARSVILYRIWLDGDLSPRVLRAAAFDEPEINGLYRWRRRLLACLHQLRGRDLQCWCPLTSSWCHADALLRAANPEHCQ